MTDYIYALHCPIANTVRYIGKTVNPESRFEDHLSAARSGKTDHHTARWLRKLMAAGLKPRLEIIEELKEGECWKEFERFYIENGAEFGWRLTNTNPGGEGGGFINAEDHAQWKLKVKAGFTPEVRDHISRAVRAAINNPATKAAQRANMQHRWKNPDYRESVLEKQRLTNSLPETKAKRSAATAKAYEDPELRKKVSASIAAYYSTPEGKENKIRTSSAPEKVAASRRSQIELWKTPAYRASQMAAKTSPDALEKQKTKAAEQWANPEVRAKMVERITLAQRARSERNKRTPEQEEARKEERSAKRREEKRLKAQAFAASPEGIAHTEANKLKLQGRFAAMSAASAAKRAQARLDRIAAKNSPEAIEARDAKKRDTAERAKTERASKERAKKEAAGIKVRRSPYPPEVREEMNKARKKAQRSAKLQAAKQAKLAESNS